jgi:AGZA family xanthine/uracil permease-like MFS transporter
MLKAAQQPKERKGSYFFTELRAGLATFFAMAYIIAVNASIVSDSGGTCVCNEPASANSVIPCENDTQYLLCKADVKKDLVTATAAIAAMGTFCMGLFANL